ncbi:hypothetical protein GQF61_11495 [Sphingobacterium sp. DK4209]|uniref:Alpha-galactosidase NEW3 domain-containing protein n=1 Tax=Sphingobacterium zhuxiongii TaxID=2662364 RepID=A0A5Q0QFU2_9SPHI|nr:MULTISPECIES: NEW3 domain-containing protein [unclassified Sphingobacterium]MVZ66484.1 hypothetical protein [Sphingobacterium sp. DK4209]QGA27861.1 hypothetical protein GFH32_16695 [Sphingobacterium sp. dk4302]
MKTIIYKTKNNLNRLLICAFFSLTIIANTRAVWAQHSSLSANLINLEATSTEVFRYQLELRHQGEGPRDYDLSAELPSGWQANFTALGSAVRAVQVKANEPYAITLEIHPSPHTKAGKFPIAVYAKAANDSLQVALQAVIKGTYRLSIRTPEERLNETIVAGGSKVLKLLVKNEGSLDLKDLAISSTLPTNWETQINPAKLEYLRSGDSHEFTVNLKAPEKSIAGDYMTTYDVKSSQLSEKADIRITVKASLLSGWLGILAIFVALSLVFYLFRTYGRR